MIAKSYIYQEELKDFWSSQLEVYDYVDVVTGIAKSSVKGCD